MVYNLWAILIVVLLSIILSKHSTTFFSFYESNAEVASSSKSIVGFRSIALAIASLCFCPPDIEPPFTPTILLKLFMLGV